MSAASPIAAVRRLIRCLRSSRGQRASAGARIADVVLSANNVSSDLAYAFEYLGPYLGIFDVQLIVPKAAATGQRLHVNLASNLSVDVALWHIVVARHGIPPSYISKWNFVVANASLKVAPDPPDMDAIFQRPPWAKNRAD
jgi:hypothetical protein